MTINPTTPEAIATVRTLMKKARFAALAVAHPDTGQPYVSRVATVAQQANMLMLISTLSIHTKALKTNPNCALLVGEPGDKGDPLTHPRLTLSGRATLTDKAAQRDAWLAAIPRAKLYFDFADFQMYRLTPTAIDFNGGFGQAFRLTPADVS